MGLGGWWWWSVRVSLSVYNLLDLAAQGKIQSVAAPLRLLDPTPQIRDEPRDAQSQTLPASSLAVLAGTGRETERRWGHFAV